MKDGAIVRALPALLRVKNRKGTQSEFLYSAFLSIFS